MGTDIAFRCTCGAVAGHLHDITPRSGLLAKCHCSQCRSAELHLDQPDPIETGVTLFQTTSDVVTFTDGQDKLAGFQFDEGRLIHWYATCCRAPMFNTMAGPKMGFASLILARVDDPALLGEVRGVGFQPDDSGKQRHHKLHRIIAGMLTRTLRVKLTGKWRITPFFDQGGQPVGHVDVLTDAQKAALPLQT